VPFTLFQNAVIVKAVVNGHDTVQLLLDTGWGPLELVTSSARRYRPPCSCGSRNRAAQAAVAVLSQNPKKRHRDEIRRCKGSTVRDDARVLVPGRFRMHLEGQPEGKPERRANRRWHDAP
jgi:hypothetical protein